MKSRIQFTPALTAALLCAAGWFGFWLFAFHPASLQQTHAQSLPEVIRLVADDQVLSKLKTPTLFALPSPEGFSGRFPENRIDLRLRLEKTANPARYLPQETRPQPAMDQTPLMEKTVILQSELPVPGTEPQPAVSPATTTQLFLSPELKSRAGELLPPNIVAAGLPETVRVNLGIRPDGQVEYAFFDTPVTNAELLRAVQQLPFKPSAETTEGWIDIRFPQKEIN